MDIGTGLALLGGAGLVGKLLGPTADYIGKGLENWTKKRVQNVSNIFEIASRKLGNRIDEEGQVPPKVLKHILDDGSFCEDELSAEYFGGVLASSRTESDIDDRGSTLIKLVSDMSSFQIRTHYIFYYMLRKAFYLYRHFVNPGTNRNLMNIYIPTSIYFETMGIKEQPSQFDYMMFETMDIEDPPSKFDYKMNVLTHSMNGLERELLIKDFLFGYPYIFQKDNLKYRFPDYPIETEKLKSHGITFTPTPGGMELFIWAHGYGHFNHFHFLREELIIESLAGIQFPNQIQLLYSSYLKKLKYDYDMAPKFHFK